MMEQAPMLAIRQPISGLPRICANGSIKESAPICTSRR